MDFFIANENLLRPTINQQRTNVLGFVLHHSGRPTDAIAPIERALQLDPSFVAALKTLALAQAGAAVHVFDRGPVEPLPPGLALRALDVTDSVHTPAELLGRPCAS